MLIIDASPPSVSGFLTPAILATRLATKLNFWYSADQLNVIDGLVAGATDLTGNGRNGFATNVADRLTYYASDSVFGGRPSFGSETDGGLRRLEAPVGLTYRHQIFSCRYLNGTVSTWQGTNLQAISAGTGTGGLPRIRSSNPGASQLVTTNQFTSTLSRGGRPQSNTVLPMPPSPYTATASSNLTFNLRIGGSVTSNLVFTGAFRHFIGVNQLLSQSEIELIEGVIAWDDGTQSQLINTHPYFLNRPLA